MVAGSRSPSGKLIEKLTNSAVFQQQYRVILQMTLGHISWNDWQSSHVACNYRTGNVSWGAIYGMFLKSFSPFIFISIVAIAQFFLFEHGMRLATRDHPHSSCKPPLCLTDLDGNSWYLHLVPFIAYHLLTVKITTISSFLPCCNVSTTPQQRLECDAVTSLPSPWLWKGTLSNCSLVSS